MDIELLEIQDFLAAHVPFDQLPVEILQQLPKSLTIRYLRRGATFPPIAEPAVYLLRQGAVDLRNPQGLLLEKLAEGDLFTTECEQDNQTNTPNGVTTEDTLLYVLPCAVFNTLCQNHPAFVAHFNASLRHRLEQVISNLQQPLPQDLLLEADVAQLIRREPVTASPDITIAEAARLMTEQDLSSLLLVEHDKLCGVLTDHDLRSRCIAANRDTGQAVRTIMTSQLHTISPRNKVADAVLLMNQHNVHHLPVEDDGKLIGIITGTDLIQQQGNNPLQLVGRIHAAQDVAELVNISRQLPMLQQQLVSSHTSCYRIGQIMSSIGDALTQHLIRLAQVELGEPPITFAWLAAGSLGRQEMHAISDQDNALLLSDEYDKNQHGTYFEQLAKFVCDGLHACGIVYCPGGIMASNPDWRQPLKVWQQYFTDWVTTPAAKNVMLACNFFDLRCLSGDQMLFERMFQAAVKLAAGNQIFLAHLAANATRHTIPLGFFRQFVLVANGEHQDRLDLKLGGIIPITELARLFALAAGLTVVNTYERLMEASKTTTLSQRGAADLHDALEFINTIRLRQQINAYAQGLAMNNYVDPQALSQLERQSLKDAFAIIRDMHSMLAQRYQTERFFT
jgi:CBS domain-containing protein